MAYIIIGTVFAYLQVGIRCILLKPNGQSTRRLSSRCIDREDRMYVVLVTLADFDKVLSTHRWGAAKTTKYNKQEKKKQRSAQIVVSLLCVNMSSQRFFLTVIRNPSGQNVSGSTSVCVAQDFKCRLYTAFTLRQIPWSENDNGKNRMCATLCSYTTQSQFYTHKVYLCGVYIMILLYRPA